MNHSIHLPTGAVTLGTMKLIVKMEHHPLTPELKEHQERYYGGEEWKGWYASIPQMKGVGESGVTQQEAFDELMISLRTKIIFDSNLHNVKP